MKLTTAIFASLAVASLAFSMPAYAGNKNKNVANSSSSSQSNAHASNRNNQSTTFNDRLQAPGLGSFGGGGCPEGLMLSVPGGGLGFQVQCKEYKQQLKYGVINGAFGREGTQRWLCENDKQVYTLPQCRAYRNENSGIRRK